MAVTVLLGGDVMLGRGVDQILPHPGRPELREPWVRDARHYVEAAERANGRIPHPVDFAWPWGEVPGILDDLAPDVRLLNLETAITADGAFEPDKGIHYRMHPGNIATLTAIRPDACALGNNHALDFGRRGLADTLASLVDADIRPVGAGSTPAEARSPAIVPLAGGHRVVIVSVAARTSGTPASWAAESDRSGLWWIDHPSARHADEIAAQLSAHRRTGDVMIVSVHWGPNWGYGISRSEQEFAHRLIQAGVDIVHGHSAHHPRPIEVYRGKPILYGCGDVIDDYEGIGGHETYRPDLRLLYLVTVDGETTVRMLPLCVRRMRLQRAGTTQTRWLRDRLDDISARYGTRVHLGEHDLLTI
ncbi:CapA family protein [Nocardia cyriacigeorgica]|uniref:CapA family protein n=1 Tax=Nocardia cyriacigeorgica TaxID=135487 RepID=A0A6P1D5J0_9NOCA|nr:CapA family protein [Nocardia cyriacigeorgica]NEW41065.1 CapA family protein [Nocardia cyriacigeorgica]NEW44330.1 CapA family protein [Nocardia cyriacigeorgica]